MVQLQRIFPGRWNWEMIEQDNNRFVTKFPSRIKLQRAVAFGGVDVKEVGGTVGLRLQFEEWQEKEEGFLLPKVWIRVFGIRKSLRKYQNLWALESMLGSTQTVDMETTRNNDFGRIMVAVLNPLLIPARIDVVIGDHYFELEFILEKKGVDENGEEMEVNWKGRGDGEKVKRREKRTLSRDPQIIESQRDKKAAIL